MKKTVITIGDPNSISPEITIKALNFLDLPRENVILVANESLLDFYKNEFDLSLEKEYRIVEIPYKKEDIKIGIESEESGEFSFKALVKACDLIRKKEANALITAPVSKNALYMAGHKYSGQTEIIEQYLSHNNQKAEMLFYSPKFSLLLITRHIALKDVPFVINKDMIIDKVIRLKNSLETQLGIKNPKLAMCALNPHASENGLFGLEEEKEIIPAVLYLKSIGINVEGPFPSDALFTDCINETCSYDCYIAMYHDQGLIPVKMLGRSNCINTTIGLDILRTSPSHGTAFDIAGKNIANPDSMIHAIKLALK